MAKRNKISTKRAFMIVSNDTIISLETKEQREKSIRRAKFEKDYTRNKTIMSGVKKTPDLIAFSNNIANQIAEFRNKRLVAQE